MHILHLNSNHLHTPLYSEILSRLEINDVNNTIIMPRKKNDEKHIAHDHLNHKSIIYHKQILNNCDRLFYFKKQRKIQKWINELNINYSDYNLIHAHTLFSDGYTAYKSNKPYIITVRNTDLNYYIKYYKHLIPLGRKIINNAENLIFLSKIYKENFITKIYVNEKEKESIFKKSYVIPNGINNFWIENQNPNKQVLEEKINVLFVGRIMKNKNIHFMIENLEDLSNKYNIELHIVGSVVDKEYFNKIKKSSIVNYHGQLGKGDLLSLMREMHIFSMISHTETFGLVYLEAITQSLPVLYTENQGFDRYYKDGFVGYPVDSRNSENFKEKFIKILNNYSEIQENIHNIHKEEFGWKFNVEKHFDLYLKSINNLDYISR